MRLHLASIFTIPQLTSVFSALAPSILLHLASILTILACCMLLQKMLKRGRSPTGPMRQGTSSSSIDTDFEGLQAQRTSVLHALLDVGQSNEVVRIEAEMSKRTKKDTTWSEVYQRTAHVEGQARKKLLFLKNPKLDPKNAPPFWPPPPRTFTPPKGTKRIFSASKVHLPLLLPMKLKWDDQDLREVLVESWDQKMPKSFTENRTCAYRKQWDCLLPSRLVEDSECSKDVVIIFQGRDLIFQGRNQRKSSSSGLIPLILPQMTMMKPEQQAMPRCADTSRKFPRIKMAEYLGQQAMKRSSDTREQLRQNEMAKTSEQQATARYRDRGKKLPRVEMMKHPEQQTIQTGQPSQFEMVKSPEKQAPTSFHGTTQQLYRAEQIECISDTDSSQATITEYGDQGARKPKHMSVFRDLDWRFDDWISESEDVTEEREENHIAEDEEEPNEEERRSVVSRASLFFDAEEEEQRNQMGMLAYSPEASIYDSEDDTPVCTPVTETQNLTFRAPLGSLGDMKAEALADFDFGVFDPENEAETGF